MHEEFCLNGNLIVIVSQQLSVGINAFYDNLSINPERFEKHSELKVLQASVKQQYSSSVCR